MTTTATTTTESMGVGRTLWAALALAGLAAAAVVAAVAAQSAPPSAARADHPLADPPEGFPDPPGLWEISPDHLVAGTTTPVQLRYVQGRDSLPPGSTHIVRFEPLSVVDLFHARPSEGIDLVPLEGHPLPQVEVEPMRVAGIGYGEVVLRFPAGLAAGDAFALDYGNRQPDGTLAALVAPIHARGLTFQIFSQLEPGGARVSWLNASWDEGLPTVDLLAAQPSRVRLFLPTLVAPGQSFRLRLAVTDEFDSRSEPLYAGAIALEAPPGLEGLPARLELAAADASVAAIEGLSCREPGVYRVRARLEGDGPWFESNPIVVQAGATEGVYWGSLHNHTLYSECWGDDLDTTFRHARDVAGFDFFGTSDHYGQLPREQGLSGLTMWRERRFMHARDGWADTVRAASAFDEPGRFATLVGYECSMNDSGHYNVHWHHDASRDPLEEAESYFLPVYCDYVDALGRLLQDSHALLIPHMHAANFPFLSLVQRTNSWGEPLTPVMEVYSDWGDGVRPLGVRDPQSRFGGLGGGTCFLGALEQGIELGVTGDADHHAGLPGRRQAFGVAPSHDHPPGLTAARMGRLDADAVLDAYRRRATYATTGERIYLDVRGGPAGDPEVPMGGRLAADGPIALRVQVAGTAPIARVSLFDGLTLAGEWTPADEDAGTRDLVWDFACDPWGPAAAPAVAASGAPAAEPLPADWRPSRMGQELTIVPGTREEQYYLAANRGSVLINGQRVVDRDRSVVYGFQFAPGAPARLDLELDQEFKVSVSPDGGIYQTVLEEPARVHMGGNREVRTVDLTASVSEQPCVFVKLTDSHPEDGWGGRLGRLVVRSEQLPTPGRLPARDIVDRPLERRHAYLVEVEQADGQLAWSSPLFVEREHQADLRWDLAPDGRPRLTNAGDADARDVEVDFSPDEHGALLPSVARPEIQRDEDVGFLWTDRLDDRRVRVHWRWRGSEALAGRVVLEGVRGYATVPNFDFGLRRGAFDDGRAGVVEFELPSIAHDETGRSVGLDFDVENDPSRPNVVRLQLEDEVLVRCDGRDQTVRELALPLNGRSSDRPLGLQVIPRLGAGESWSPAEGPPGFWSVDPADRIPERDEDDNLWRQG